VCAADQAHHGDAGQGCQRQLFLAEAYWRTGAARNGSCPLKYCEAHGLDSLFLLFLCDALSQRTLLVQTGLCSLSIIVIGIDGLHACLNAQQGKALHNRHSKHEMPGKAVVNCWSAHML
jgi:hypothetical protein